MKYRCKIDTPWYKKGKLIEIQGNKPFWWGKYCSGDVDLNNYPDLFETIPDSPPAYEEWFKSHIDSYFRYCNAVGDSCAMYTEELYQHFKSRLMAEMEKK